MNNKKSLIERKNSILEEMERITKTCEIETRALTEDESKKFDELKAIAEQLIKTISSIDDMKSLSEKSKVEEGEEKENMGNTEKRNYVEEVRALTTATNGDVIPEGLANDIVRKLQEKSNVINECSKITYTGDYAVLQEGEPLVAEVLGETENAQPKDLSKFTKVVLKDKRISVVTTVSRTVLHNSPVIGINYLSEKVAQAVANKIENETFVADGTEKHLTKGLLTGGKVINGDVTLEGMMETLSDMNPLYLQGAKWYVNRETFKALSLLMNANKQPYMALDVAGQTPVYKFLGLPVVITDSVDSVVLANVKQSVTLKLSEKSNIQVLNELYATSGQVGFLCEFYGDLAVTNPDAVRILKKATGLRKAS